MKFDIRHSLFFRVSVMIVLLVTANALASRAADSTDFRHLDDLRQQRKFVEAQQYCRDRLNDAKLSDMQRSALVVQLARTLAEHATQTSPDRRAPLWDQAHAACAELLESLPQSPRRLLVQLQDALLWLASGELTRQEAEDSVLA